MAEEDCFFSTVQYFVVLSITFYDFQSL